MPRNVSTDSLDMDGITRDTTALSLYNIHGNVDSLDIDGIIQDTMDLSLDDMHGITQRTMALSLEGRDRNASRVATSNNNNGGDISGISNQLIPWTAPSLQIREFSKCNDEELFEYLSARRVSTGFLVEIDQFLRAHPEIGTCSSGRKLLENINNLSPLGAYKEFVKDYTRPATYIGGIIKDADIRFPEGFRPQPLATAEDEELEAFLTGFEGRNNVLERIDEIVQAACAELERGQSLSFALVRLVCYSVHGNPVDAYKWYEFNYQQGCLAHWYLPDHFVLTDIPKPGNYTEPEPFPGRTRQKHNVVRLRMAKARDEGIDVLDVLLSEYREALADKGHGRVEIDSSCERAKNLLDNEREYPTGLDVVDMIMGDVSNHLPAAPTTAFP